MLVKDLIKKLEKVPKETMVVIDSSPRDRYNDPNYKYDNRVDIMYVKVKKVKDEPFAYIDGRASNKKTKGDFVEALEIY